MIIAVKSSVLSEILNQILTAPENAVIQWREMMETHASAPCAQCTYDGMLGRRCCCLCLESNLLHAQFVENAGVRLKSAYKIVKSHREEACGACFTGT